MRNLSRLCDKNYHKRQIITKIRSSAHRLEIETERYNVNRKIDVQNHICKQYCCSNEVEDEEHFVQRCDKYKVERSEFLTTLYEIFNVMLQIKKNAFLMKTA